MFRTFLIFLLSVSGFNAQKPRSAGDCAMVCNDLRTTVLTMAICADAKKTLPRPKVGDFCSIAMEQGFSDACVSLCMGNSPIPRLAQTCRSASIEMPRPTVRKWCEHGYTVGFQKTVQDLRTYFLPPKEEKSFKEEVHIEPVVPEVNIEPVVPEVNIEPVVPELVESTMPEDSIDPNIVEHRDQPVFESQEDQGSPVQNEENPSVGFENAATEEFREADALVENESVPPLDTAQEQFDAVPGSFEDQAMGQNFEENVPVE